MHLFLNLKIVDVLSIIAALLTIIGSVYTLYVWNEKRRRKQRHITQEIGQIKETMLNMGAKKELVNEVERKLDKITDLLT